MKFPINSPNDVAGALTVHYMKEGHSNFLGGGTSLVLATAVLEIYEIGDVQGD